MKAISLFLALVMLATPLAMPLAQAQTQEAKKTTVAIQDMDPKGVPVSEVSALSDRLRSELFNTGAFDVMERGKMQEILKEQGFQQSGACNTDACAIEVGQLIGVEKMIGGSLGKVGKTYTVNLRLIDVKTGRINQSLTEDYTGEIDRLLTVTMKSVAQKLAYAVNYSKTKGKQPAPISYPSMGGGGGSVFTKWWFWGGIGAVAAGGAAAALAGKKSTTTQPTTPPDNNPPAEDIPAPPGQRP